MRNSNIVKFDQIQFKPFRDGKSAVIYFDNKMSVTVTRWSGSYADEDSYELAIRYKGEFTGNAVYQDVIGYCEKDEIEDILNQVKSLSVETIQERLNA